MKEFENKQRNIKVKIDLSKIDELFEKSNLPEDCSKEFVDELLLKIRKM